MKKKIIVCFLSTLVCAILISCSGTSLESKAFTTNRSYVHQFLPAYLNFYNDGTYEMVQFGTYRFDEKEGNKLVYLDFDEQEVEWAYSDAFVITDGEKGSLQLIPAMLFFEPDTPEQQLIESSIHLTYSSVMPTEQDGLKNGMSAFSGEYQFAYEDLTTDASLVFCKEGYFVQRITSEYNISKNNLITLNKTKFTYEENEETGELSLKTADEQLAGTYVKANADNGIHYVIPFDGYCYCDGGHKYIVVTSGVFENPSSNLIEENKLYAASFYTNDTDFSFADLNAIIADLDTGEILDLCDLTVTSSDGSASISLFQMTD